MSISAKERKHTERQGVIYASWIVIMIGLVFSLVGLVGCWMVLSIFRWPTVPGRVTAHAVETVSDSMRFMRATWFKPIVRYEYKLDNQAFTGNVIAREPYRSEEQIQSAGILRNYPINSQVTVYVHPSDPTRAMLENRLTRFEQTMLTIGGSVALLGLIWFAILRRMS